MHIYHTHVIVLRIYLVVFLTKGTTHFPGVINNASSKSYL